jgi:hypothetical protein
MSDLDKPPLHPPAYDLIKLALRRVELMFTPRLRGMQTSVIVNIPGQLPPELIPDILRGLLRQYASVLFKTEADQYPLDAQLEHWLSKLAGRATDRVMETIERIETGAAGTLEYHGITKDEMCQTVSEFLQEAAQSYLWQRTQSQDQTATPAPLGEAAPEAPPTPEVQEIDNPMQSNERLALRDSYRASFPDVKIQDICWAAEQTYREWRRWINGEAKDGLKPDRAFRHVLTSNKKPEEIRRQPRPTKYNY